MSVEKVKNHLEFLGFDVALASEDGPEQGTLLAKHPIRWNIRITVKPDWMFLDASVVLDPKSINFGAANRQNAGVGPVKVSLDDDGDLYCALFYIGAYDRQNLGYALDALETGITMALEPFYNESR